MLKIGLIGLGHLGKIHLKLLKQIPQFELVGVYDVDIENAQKVAESFDVPCFHHLEALLDKVQAVDIVTPTLSHFAIAKQALASGKHVFIEKPVTHTPEEARLLLELQSQTNLIVQVGHVERYNPAFLALENSPLSPMFIEGHRLAIWNPRGTDVSVVLDLMIHDLDIILSVVKSPVKNIHASGIAVIADSPDIANVRLEFENGCVANLTASRISLKNMRKVRFFQPHHYISVDFLEKKLDIIRLPEDGEAYGDGKMIFDFDTGKEKKQMVMEQPEIRPVNSILMELTEFAQAILSEKPVRVSLSDGYNALLLAYQILEKMNANVEHKDMSL
jgi:predicted dehydrogenase